MRKLLSFLFVFLFSTNVVLAQGFTGVTPPVGFPQSGSGGGGSGTVTSASVVSANGFAGSVASPTTTPAITLTTTITGLLKGNGTAISAASSSTDYQVPITLTTTGTSGAATFAAGTLNIPQYNGAPAGSTGQVQYNNGGVFGGLSTATINGDNTLNISSWIVSVSGTSKTLALTDKNSLQVCTNAATQTITVPLNATVAFPVGTIISFEQWGAGSVIVQGAASVTVNGVSAGASTTASQYSGMYLRKDATDSWAIVGGNPSGAATYSALTVNGSMFQKMRVVTAAGAVTVGATDYVVVVHKGTGAATTVNLPAGGSTNQCFWIKDGKGDAATNNITVTPAAGNIDGSSTYVINTNYGAAMFVYNTTDSIWNVF